MGPCKNLSLVHMKVLPNKKGANLKEKRFIQSRRLSFPQASTFTPRTLPLQTSISKESEAKFLSRRLTLPALGARQATNLLHPQEELNKEKEFDCQIRSPSIFLFEVESLPKMMYLFSEP